MRADRSQRLVVSSRIPEKDAPFLEGVEYHDVTRPDWTEGWMGNGRAVLCGVWFFAGLVTCIYFGEKLFLPIARAIEAINVHAIASCLARNIW